MRRLAILLEDFLTWKQSLKLWFSGDRKQWCAKNRYVYSLVTNAFHNEALKCCKLCLGTCEGKWQFLWV